MLSVFCWFTFYVVPPSFLSNSCARLPLLDQWSETKKKIRDAEKLQ